MTYIKQSVRRPDGNPGVGIKVRDLITLIDVNDIAVMPERDSKGVVIAGNIILKPCKYGYNIYMTPGTVEITSAADGDMDQVGFTPSVKFNHPGNEQEVREFKTNSVNRKFVIIVRYCSGKPADLIGSPCNPCKLTPSYTGNNDSNFNEMTFEQISKGDDIAIYRGTIPAEEPVSVVAAEATSISFTAEGQYQLSAGEAEINAINGGADGAVITLLGVAGENVPTVKAGANLLLKGGSDFVATEGSQLTLVCHKTGANTYTWVEQSRYEIS